MNKQIKNYIGFANDHSGSMYNLTRPALTDYNTNIKAVKEAATREMQDTIVSVLGFGGDVTRDIVNSNPHVLKAMSSWRASGGTPMFRALKEMIELFKSMPDYKDPTVSFVVLTTTDGEATDGYLSGEVANEIRSLINNDRRWTFVFRVPKAGVGTLLNLGIPAGNIQAWDQTAAGFTDSTQATTAAFDNFYAARSAGKTSSTVFYASAAAVDTSKLKELVEGKDVSLYQVPNFPLTDKLEIRDFILTKRMKYLKGAAFYQLTKTEAKVQPSKLIVVRDRTTGKIFAGTEARLMLGLPTDRNVRLHPGDHGNFDLFIQSSSVNRHLVPNTGVLYWEAIGVEFTEADLAYLQPKPVAPAVMVLPAVAPTNKPTKSPLVPTPKAPVAPAVPTPIVPNDGGRVRYHTAPMFGATFYSTRDMARAQAMVQGKKQYDAGPTAAYGKRFYVA